MKYKAFVSAFSKRVVSCFLVLLILCSFAVPCYAAGDTLVIPVKPSVSASEYPYWMMCSRIKSDVLSYYIVYSRDKGYIDQNRFFRFGEQYLIYTWTPESESSDWVLSGNNLTNSVSYSILCSNYEITSNYDGSVIPIRDETYFVESVRSNLGSSYDIDDTLWYGSSFDGSTEDNSGILSGLSNILSAIKNGFNNLISSIIAIPGKIVDGIKELLIYLFVPSDDYFSEQVDSLKTSLEEKLPIGAVTEIIETVQTASAGEMPNVEVDYMGVHATIVNFDFFREYKPTINSWIRGFMFVLMAFYWIDQIYKLIRGVSLFSGSGRGSSEVPGQLFISDK